MKAQSLRGFISISKRNEKNWKHDQPNIFLFDRHFSDCCGTADVSLSLAGQSSRHLCRTCTKGTPFIMDASSIFQTLRYFCHGQCIPIQCDVEIPIRKLCCADFWSSFGCERALLHSSSSQWTHLMYLNIASLTMWNAFRQKTHECSILR